MCEDIQLFPDKINHDLYFEISKDNLEKALAIQDKIDRHESSLPYEKVIPTLSEHIEHYKKMWKSTTVSLVFSILTIEAFINYYYLSHGFSIKDLKKLDHLEKKEREDLKSKFRIPKDEDITSITVKWIKAVTEINGDRCKGIIHENISTLQSICKFRNKLIHYKPRISSDTDKRENIEMALKSLLGQETKQTNYQKHFNQVSLQETQECHEMVIKLIKSLKSIDPSSVEDQWLYEGARL